MITQSLRHRKTRAFAHVQQFTFVFSTSNKYSPTPTSSSFYVVVSVFREITWSLAPQFRALECNATKALLGGPYPNSDAGTFLTVVISSSICAHEVRYPTKAKETKIP